MPALKIGIQAPLLPGATLDERFAAAARLGFDGVELTVSADADLDALQLEVVAASTASGLPVAAICTSGGHDPLRDDADEQVRRFALLAGVVALADALGATGVISVPHRPPGRFGAPEERARFVTELTERAVDAYGAWAAALPKGSAAVFLEPLNRYESSFLNRVGQAVDIAQRIDHRRVLALADLFHMNIEETDMAAPIADAGSLLGHVHVADNNRLEPGAGCLDLVPSFAALAEIEYDGFVSLECGLSATGDERERVLAATVAYLRDQWTTAGAQEANGNGSAGT